MHDYIRWLVSQLRSGLCRLWFILQAEMPQFLARIALSMLLKSPRR